MGYFLSLSKSATSIELDISELGLLLFALVVAVGVAGEIKLAWWHPRLRAFEIAGLIGVLGEMLADGGVFLFSSRLQSIMNAELVHARVMAESARESAAQVESSNKRLGIDLEVEKQKTAAAQLALEKQIRLQGPRWRFLDEHRSDIVERVKRFEGQSAVIVVCGSPNSDGSDKMRTTDTLLDVLANGRTGAAWKVALQNDEYCVGSPTVQVFFSPKAPQAVQDAALALGKVLGQFIPSALSAASPFDTGASGFAQSRSFLGKNSAFVTLASHPDSVVILLGPHP